MHLTMAPSHAPVDAQNRPPKVLHLCTTTVDTHYFANLGAGLADAGLEVLMGSVTALPRPPWMDGQARVRYFSLGARSRLGLIPALGRLIPRERAQRLELTGQRPRGGGLIAR